MASNKDTTLMEKNNAGKYIPMYPKTSKSQVIGWDVGEIYGPYILTLKASQWERNKQTLNLVGVSIKDMVYCVNVLNGTKEQMLAQKKAYNLLDTYVGIESLNNQVQFTAKETPQVDIKVQVWWTK